MTINIEDAKAAFWRSWAIDGMPKDKQRLAEAAWTAASVVSLVASHNQLIAESVAQSETPQS